MSEAIAHAGVPWKCLSSMLFHPYVLRFVCSNFFSSAVILVWPHFLDLCPSTLRESRFCAFEKMAWRMLTGKDDTLN
jgi:hypothetical protein